jgi:hypothetical protein
MAVQRHKLLLCGRSDTYGMYGSERVVVMVSKLSLGPVFKHPVAFNVYI